MPTYTYRCPKCKKINEVVHKISEDPVIYCDCIDRINSHMSGEIQLTPMTRVIKNFDNKVLFKGKGWDGVPDYNTH